MGGIQGIVSLVARVALCSFFVMSAAMYKIPKFAEVVGIMEAEGVPAPKITVGVAIAFLLVGSLLVIIGYKARIGALLLLICLGAATYYLHDFWTLAEGDLSLQNEKDHFMKNVSLMGAMLLVVANGAGAWGLDTCCRKTPDGDDNDTD